VLGSFHLGFAATSRSAAMVVISSLQGTTRPKEIIEQTFNVFCGSQRTMDEVGFSKFCESSKRALGSDASHIFLTVVQDVHQGMDLGEFKEALALLVNANGGRGGNRTDRKALSGNSSKLIKPARQSSMEGKASLENQRPMNSLGAAPKTSSTFRWSPLDVGCDESPSSRSRAIRWCPADLEE